jgi:DNA modification methylase
VANDERIDWSDAWKLCLGPVIYCWHAGRNANQVQQSLEAAGFTIRSQIIWAKPIFPISRGHYHWQHEPCWYAYREGEKALWVGGRSQTTLWEIGRDENAEGGHGTQKPLECMARPIRNHAGDVYDPFVGSGTTFCAAQLLDRTCYGMEIEPKYVAVALERLSDMGLKPKLIRSGHRVKTPKYIRSQSSLAQGSERQPGRPAEEAANQ